MLQITIRIAPEAIVPQAANRAILPVLGPAAHPVGQARNKDFPGLTETATAQVITQGRLFDETTESHAAVGIDMKFPLIGNAAGKEAVTDRSPACGPPLLY